MNLLLYVTLLKVFILCIVSIINCDNNKIFVCSQNSIEILYDTSNDAKSKVPCLPMTTSCFQFKKHFKKKEIKIQPIYKGPEISDFIQSGIQETIRFSKKYTDKDTYRFYERNNLFVDMPFPIKEFKFQAFAPDNFLTLRNLYKISEDFDSSFQTSKVQPGSSNEDFMETYYYTEDYKFYINIITIENFEFIVSYLSKYFSHFCKNQLSLLPKISGLFHLKHNNFELYFIVKPYIFPNVPRSTDIVYYTKGNLEKGNLIADVIANPKTCRKEVDIIHSFRSGLIIPSDTYKSLQNVLENDKIFLHSLNISDYIFMLSVSSSNKSYNKLKSALVNILRVVTNSEQCDTKTDSMNFIAYIGIDNIYQKKKKG